MKINSPEFAQAWRIVSEALLEYVQTACEHRNSSISESSMNGTENGKEEIKEPIATEQSLLSGDAEIRYASNPIHIGNGYEFNCLSKKMDDSSAYKIYKYENGVCRFELCLMSSDMLADTDRWIPGAVVKSRGEIPAGCSIVTVKRGEGEADGRSVRITAPLEVEFKN